MSAQHPYADFLHLVQKPARYVGGEYGARPKDWAAVEARVCLAFPDVYDIGMSHLGFKILYGILNDEPRTLAERAFCPWIDMEKELRARGLPLVSLETARPLRDFDVVGFSLQFELTYTNVLTMLDLGGVPLRAADRGDGDPLVIAGGPNATHPEPLSAFVDAFAIGDGEELARDVALTWARMKAAGAPRAERLRDIAELRAVYVPSLVETHVEDDTGFRVVTKRDGLPVRRALVASLDAYPFPARGPVGGPEAVFDRMSIELARGCTEGCRFCQAGMIYRPVRERDPAAVVETVRAAVKDSGYDEVSLTSLSTADYSAIAPRVEKVAGELSPQRISLGVSSLRAYGLPEQTLDDLSRVRASGLTFAPEAGSQRMRDVVNKNVTEAQLMETAERVFARGFTTMKLYFMIGLPTEQEDDVREIVRVGKRAREVGKRVAKARGAGPPKVTVSVSTHVPKPHTPFQWCAMDRAAMVREKQGWLEEEARGSGVDLRVHDSRGSWLEGVFARGDRTLCDVLERAWRAGARFDSWEDQLHLGIWEDAFDAAGVDPTRFLGTIPVTARLPWDHIDVGLDEGFLAREYKKALKDRLSPPCGKAVGQFVHHTNLDDAAADARKLVCYDCGVACDLGAMREERLVALRRLGAEHARAPSAEVEAPRAARKTPARIVQGEARRYRFGYTKLGPAALLSHLDLIRALPRSFRRLELPLFYSSGFHPKPEMTFGPALPLGVQSTSEVVDVKLAADLDPAEWLERLSAASPAGLRFFAGARLGPNDAAVSKLIDAARYALLVPLADLAPRGDGWLDARVSEYLAKTEARVMRSIDGVGKWIETRSFVRSIARGGVEAAAAAGIAGAFAALTVDVEVRGSGGVKIAEVAEAMGLDVPWLAVRTALGRLHEGAVIAPCDLEALRAARAASAATATPTPADDVTA